MGQLLVVGDRDTGLDIGLRGGEVAADAELGTLSHGLMGHGERGQDQHVAASVLMHLVGPLKLHGGLAHTAIGPDAEPANTAGHGHDVALKGKERSGEMVRVEANGLDGALLAR